ncbi:hypothetical protein GCM10007906_05360 [Vibrio hyugaensis]|uniref:Uncharacterized protein n=1 Tax=Vibrio hyugaensis TaxID=1534743 RepID=A0ABQ5Y0B8_9VIBR|nr:hypothetical protein GCM10007906_05360 [Vibrio hyugaensis]
MSYNLIVRLNHRFDVNEQCMTGVSDKKYKRGGDEVVKNSLVASTTRLKE